MLSAYPKFTVLGILSGSAIGGRFMYNDEYERARRNYKIVPTKILIGPTICGMIAGACTFPITVFAYCFGLSLDAISYHAEWSKQVLEEANKHKK